MVSPLASRSRKAGVMPRNSSSDIALKRSSRALIWATMDHNGLTLRSLDEPKIDLANEPRPSMKFLKIRPKGANAP